jgi:hypothetical protein
VVFAQGRQSGKLPLKQMIRDVWNRQDSGRSAQIRSVKKADIATAEISFYLAQKRGG